MLSIFSYPFIQRALLAGFVLAVVLSFIGIFVVLKKISFLGEGVAHASLAGIAIGLITATNPLIVAIIYSILFSLVVYFLEKKTTVSTDAIIGVLFTASMALGVILVNTQAGYQPELISYLFGNILTIKTGDLLIMVLFSVIILLFLLFKYKKITLTIFDRDSAYLSGINTTFYELGLYISLAISIVLGVKVLGIVLVSAILIIPASIAKMLSRSFKQMIFDSIVVSEIIVIGGILLSYVLDYPTGPVIILLGTTIFFLTFLASKSKFI